ncbi:DUF4192 family protein [Nocardia sp. NPDC023852]|uniref:DUF4192 family protein n=1 Tax=Nocardia sp. NPDC023852 TaxID=3154697 RepID=UPI0033E29071
MSSSGDPGDFIAAVPAMLGLVPERSLVVMIVADSACRGRSTRPQHREGHASRCRARLPDIQTVRTSRGAVATGFTAAVRH